MLLSKWRCTKSALLLQYYILKRASFLESKIANNCAPILLRSKAVTATTCPRKGRQSLSNHLRTGRGASFLKSKIANNCTPISLLSKAVTAKARPRKGRQSLSNHHRTSRRASFLKSKIARLMAVRVITMPFSPASIVPPVLEQTK